jgi:asparagine synthase (glutamine-hydrolysing)
VLLHLYARLGIERAVQALDGYFAFVLLDGETLYAGRDVIGVRPLFLGTRGDATYLASEVKAIHDLCDTIQPFPPGTWWSSTDASFHEWSSALRPREFASPPYAEAVRTARALLEQAVRKRIETSERPIGSLLSGGLDSSIVCALANRYSLERLGRPIHTFSIGLPGSTDLKYARIVAEHLGTVHTEVLVTENEMLEAIPEVVSMIESYDTTSVRASTPMYLLCKYIRQHTDITVLLSGEGSDELSGSYLYFYRAPSAQAFYAETVRLCRDLWAFDVLRADRCVAAHGLELRLPFLDQEFVEWYLHLDPVLKMPVAFGIEKKLLREAFADVLPECVAQRTKAAFSDAVSAPDHSWSDIIQTHVQRLVRDGLDVSRAYAHAPPALDESRWYRWLYDTEYPGREALIPYLWLPRWCDQLDPSARKLDVYAQIGTQQ